jgi:acyl dehydratase
VGSLLAWESLVTFFARGRFGESGPEAALARSPTEFGSLADEWTPRDAGHWRFGGFTGDYNGIHFWDAYARNFGFPRALFHPQRVLGESLGRLARSCGGDQPQRLDAWLKGPVPHGARVRLHATRSPDATTFALFVEPERPCIVGRLSCPRTGR